MSAIVALEFFAGVFFLSAATFILLKLDWIVETKPAVRFFFGIEAIAVFVILGGGTLGAGLFIHSIALMIAG